LRLAGAFAHRLGRRSRHAIAIARRFGRRSRHVEAFARRAEASADHFSKKTTRRVDFARNAPRLEI
jgi:hypothetical protein